VLEANPDYREKGKPKVDILEFSFMPEPSGRIAALEVGQFDIAYALPGHQVPRMEAMPDVTPLKKRALRPIVWFFNMRHPILSDPTVRRALVHAVDMDLIGETILEHGGKVLEGYITQGAYGGLEMPFGYKPEYSALLLAQAGWSKNSDGIYEKNGKKLTLTAQIGVDRYPDILAVGEATSSRAWRPGCKARGRLRTMGTCRRTTWSPGGTGCGTAKPTGRSPRPGRTPSATRVRSDTGPTRFSIS
jgi:peptide/nickel transport system substrate-binding protein